MDLEDITSYPEMYKSCNLYFTFLHQYNQQHLKTQNKISFQFL